MAITAAQLLQASQLEPEDLGEDIVSPALSETLQRAAAVAWIEANVLPIADAEVSVPLLKSTGYDTISGFINGHFSDEEAATLLGWTTKGEALYDGAVLSYGRSEINKSINSSSDTYDRDSDQDRIQGNQRLAKLIEWATVLIETAGDGGASDSDAPASSMAVVTARWY